MYDDDIAADDSKEAEVAALNGPGPLASVQAKRNAAVLQRMRADAVLRKQVDAGRAVHNHGIFEHMMVFSTKF